ncbi:hypothetical protein S245_036619, partial [Arachis hypogaea]
YFSTVSRTINPASSTHPRISIAPSTHPRLIRNPPSVLLRPHTQESACPPTPSVVSLSQTLVGFRTLNRCCLSLNRHRKHWNITRVSPWPFDVINRNLKAFQELLGWLKRNTRKGAYCLEHSILNWKDLAGNTILHVAALNDNNQCNSGF